MIDNNRINHIMGVARLMRDNAVIWGLDEKDMFTLGLLHDIGYEFGSSEEHHIIGCEMLKNQGYKYYKEVLYHGKPINDYSSKELDLLNFADMSVDKQGNIVSFDDRLKDIATRRGEDSHHYQNCKIIIDGLISKGFKSM